MALAAVVMIVWLLGGLAVAAAFNKAQLAAAHRRTPEHATQGRVTRIDAGSTTTPWAAPASITRRSLR
jgi:hypothetical protein